MKRTESPGADPLERRGKVTRLDFEKWVLEAGSDSWTIYEKRVAGVNSKRAGETVELALSFHGKLGQALDRLLDLGLREAEAKSVEELRTELRRLSAALRTMGEQADVSRPADAHRAAGRGEEHAGEAAARK